jgi:hypothetical protein
MLARQQTWERIMAKTNNTDSAHHRHISTRRDDGFQHQDGLADTQLDVVTGGSLLRGNAVNDRKGGRYL